jgi:hypothetical protein
VQNPGGPFPVCEVECRGRAGCPAAVDQFSVKSLVPPECTHFHRGNW